MEQDRTYLEKNLRESEQEKEKLIKKVAKLEDDKKMYMDEANDVDRQLEKTQTELTKTVEKGKMNAKRVVSLEIENEELQNEARRRGFIISDLEMKFDTQLEEIELLRNDLEEQQLHSDEQIERLKQQLHELQTELQVRDRELRLLKLKTLFESPAQKKSKKVAQKDEQATVGDQSKGSDNQNARSARLFPRSKSRAETEWHDEDKSEENA